MSKSFFGVHVPVLAVAVMTACTPGPRSKPGANIGANTATPSASPADTGFDAMRRRGEEAMGVNQYMSTHHFTDLDDGGRIELQSDSGKAAEVAAIRAHLRHITSAFADGDFSDPAFVHMGAVPGTDVMRARRSQITYTFSELPRGGAVRIRTRDAESLKAIHTFLEFQRTAHRTHDMSGHVQ